MINKKIQNALNGQINLELYSAYLYLAMSAYFESKNLQGTARWMRVQWGEEIKHAMKLFEYINERSGRVELKAIKEPQIEWNSPLAAFEDAYKHECHVSETYNKLMTEVLAAGDHATSVFLQWYVNEQVEEEASVLIIVEKLRLIKDAPAGLFIMDKELGQRQ